MLIDGDWKVARCSLFERARMRLASEALSIDLVNALASVWAARKPCSLCDD